METTEQLRDRLLARFPGAVQLVANPGPAAQHSLLLEPAHARAIAEFLRDDPALLLDYCSNATGVDWPDKEITETVKVTVPDPAGGPAKRTAGKGDLMPTLKLQDIRGLRKSLGVSQSQAARLLGVSTKAVQSYEQGLRTVPPHVQRTSALLLYTRWRKQHGQPAPCWTVAGCRPADRSRCPAYLQQAGDLCWMLSGTKCRGGKPSTPAAKLAQCQQCRVMKRWLKT